MSSDHCDITSNNFEYFLQQFCVTDGLFPFSILIGILCFLCAMLMVYLTKKSVKKLK